MELAEIRPFEPQMAEIDLFTMPDAVGVGEPSVRKQKPYIAGHVTDGSSTFTFTINGNESVTVPVDANGNWKWVQDRDITSLYRAFYRIINVDYVEINLPKLPYMTTAEQMFHNFGYNGSTQVVTSAKCFIKKFDTSNCTTLRYMFNGAGFIEANLDKFTSTSSVTDFEAAFNLQFAKEIDLRKIDVSNCSTANSIRRNVWYAQSQMTTLQLGKFLSNPATDNAQVIAGNCYISTITADEIKISISFSNCLLLTEQTIVNLFNAVAADGITLTFHATVYAMIQAQLDIEDSPIYNAYWNSDYDFDIASA